MSSRRLTVAAGALAVLLALTGCGASNRTVTSSHPGTSVTGVTAPAVPGHLPTLLLDASSSGSHAAKVGQLVQLTLSTPGMRWSGAEVMPVGPLAPDPSPSPPANGVLAIWTAAETGTVSISALGKAACSAGMACPMYARLFRVTVVIS